MRELAANIVEYIELTSEIIEGLQKKAADAAKPKPVFSEALLQEAGQTLVDANLLSKEANERLTQAFRDSPDKALQCLIKVAKQQQKSGEHRKVASVVDRKENKLTQGQTEADAFFIQAFNR